MGNLQECFDIDGKAVAKRAIHLETKVEVHRVKLVSETAYTSYYEKRCKGHCECQHVKGLVS